MGRERSHTFLSRFFRESLPRLERAEWVSCRNLTLSTNHIGCESIELLALLCREREHIRNIGFTKDFDASLLDVDLLEPLDLCGR